MKNLFVYSLISAGILLSACSDDDSASQSAVNLELSVPSDVAVGNISGSYYFTNVTSQLVTQVAYGESIVLNDGLYNVKFIGTATVEGEQVAVQGAQTNLTVSGGSVSLTLELFIIDENSGLVIMEIFPTGTVTNENKAYTGDQYIKLYNNSADTIYADGLFIAESQFLTVTKYDYSPDIMGEYMTVDALFTIPGNGTDYPVYPGDSIVICDNAINHKEANPNSCDLSSADFEWYTVSTSSSVQDVDNPDVANLNRAYCYSATIWILNKQGNKAYAIGRFPQGVSAESFSADYAYTCNYVMSTGATSKDYTYYKVPNSWITDAVNLSPKNKYVWNAIAPSLDLGYTYVGENSTISENYGNAVRRKVLLTQPDGRKLLKDTNNSSDDFEPAVRASELSK